MQYMYVCYIYIHYIYIDNIFLRKIRVANVFIWNYKGQVDYPEKLGKLLPELLVD